MSNDLFAAYDRAMQDATGKKSESKGKDTPADGGVDLFEQAGVKPEPRMERTWGEAISDTGVQIAEGAANIAGAIPNLLAPDGRLAEITNDAADYWRDKQSMPMQRRAAAVEDAIAQADQDSILDQAAAAAKAYGNDPAMMARLVATNLPSMVIGGGAAKLGQMGAAALGASRVGAAAVGANVGGATNAALNAGGARGDAYQDLVETLKAQGYSEPEAQALALDKSRLPAAVGGAAGFISGRSGLEKMIVGRGLASGGAGAAARAAGAEIGGELMEELSPQATTNYQASEYDQRPLSRDIGRTAVETAIASGPTAGITAVGAGFNKNTAAQSNNVADNAAPSNDASQSAGDDPSAAVNAQVDAIVAQAVEQERTQAQNETPEQARARHPEGNPLDMEEAKASARLAELEVVASTTGLSDEQKRERLLLAHRLDELAAKQEAYALPEENNTRANDTIDPADLPDAGEDVGQGGTPAAATKASEVKAQTWPQFVLERGYKVSELRKGTPAWDQLQSEWSAVKTHRAGLNPQGTGAQGEPVQQIQNRDRSRPASVIQMQNMAANLDYLRLGVARTPDSGAPMVFATGDVINVPHVLGVGDVAAMSDGQRVPFQYAVMEAADIQPSNFADGSVNPLFDAQHPGVIKALNNGRTAAARAAYERGTAEQYKQELMADTRAHGIPAEAIADMKAPVLVRLYSEKDNRHNMGAKSQSQSAGLSATEQAATDAHVVDDKLLDLFEAGQLDSAGNADFVRGFVGSLQQAGQDVAGIMDAGGKLSPSGVERIAAALTFKAYDDGDLVETMFGSQDNDIRGLGQALRRVAGQWANMRRLAKAGAIAAEADITANLMQAVRMVEKARRDRVALVDLANQVDMETGQTAPDITVAMLRMLYSGEYMTRARGADAVAQALQDYITAAMATPASGEADMFGEVVTVPQILSALTGQVFAADNAPAALTNEPTQASNDARTEDTSRAAAPASEQGRAQERDGQPIGSDPASGGDDPTSQEGSRPAPGTSSEQPGQDGAGSAGQAAQAQEEQSLGQSDSDAAQSDSDALSSYTAEEIRAQQAAQEAADKAEREAQAQAEREEKARKDKADIDARQAASADNFQLGQDPMDALAGQGSIFDAPAATEKEATSAKQQSVSTDKATETKEPQSQDAIKFEEGGREWEAHTRQGKGQIKDKFLVELNGDGVPGGPWDSQAQALQAARAWADKVLAQEKRSAENDKRWSDIRTKLDAGEMLQEADLQFMGLRRGYTDMRWFIPAAARLFGIDARKVRPVVADMVEYGQGMYGGRKEFVSANGGLKALAKAYPAPQQAVSTAAKNEAAKAAPVAASDPVVESQRAIISQNTRSRLTRAYNGEEYRGKKEDYATLRADLEQVAADTSNPNSAQAKEVLDAVDQAIQNLEAQKRYKAEREQAPASQATDQAAQVTEQAESKNGKTSESDVERAGGFVMPEGEVFAYGDEAQSPWLMADGKVVGTGQDHLAFAETMLMNEGVEPKGRYDQFMRAKNAVRASFFKDVEEGYVAMLHTRVGQKITGDQVAFLKRLSDANGGKLKIMRGQADGLVNPEYKPVSLGDLSADAIADADLNAMFDDLMAEEFGQQEQAAPAPKAPAKPKNTAAQKREAQAKKLAEISEKHLGGAVAGDTITASKDFDYVTGGKPMLIESIDARGEVYVHDPVGGGRTSFKADMASARGVTFAVQPKQEAAKPGADLAKLRKHAERGVLYHNPETGATWTGKGKPPLWIAARERAPFEIQNQIRAAAIASHSDDWQGTIQKTREYAKNLLDAGLLDADKAKAAWVSHDALVELVQSAIAPAVTQHLASAASNAADALTAAIDGLGALFGGAGKLNSGLSFDEETYAKAKPLFAQAVASMGAAGQDLREAMRAIIKMVADKFGVQATRNMQPYIVRYVQDLKESQDVPSATAGVEPDSSQPAAVPANARADAVQDAPAAGRDGGQASGPASSASAPGQQDNTGVSVDAAALVGKRSDQRLHSGNGPAGSTDSATRVDELEGSPAAGRDGVPFDPIPAGEIASLAAQARQRDSNAGADASTSVSKPARKDEARGYELGSEQHAQSVRNAIPQLLPGQVADVVKAEIAYAKPDGHGMLFTNGTGTGKTFTGLGVARRFADQGKKNILIIVPDDKIASDWIASAKVVGLDAYQLANTKDAGKGVTVTTYANLGENNALASRQWDLVIPDEAHTLMSNQQADMTLALRRVRALTYHPDGAFVRHTMVNAEKLAKRQELADQAQYERGFDNAQRDAVAKDLEDQVERLDGELQASLEAIKAEFASATKDGKRTKMLALSATPFAYEKNIEWAEGYMFSYGEGMRDDQREFRGYNEGGNREQFFMRHFGYRMRYNKLTEPEPGVDRGLMQRQFNTWLKQRGVLSSRMLEVDADYDRRFVLFDSAIGNRIDEALAFLSEKARDSTAWRSLADAVNNSLDYQAKRYLLEAMKAPEAVRMAREHMAKGRKVIVFHDFIKGGGTNPFDVEFDAGLDAQQLAEAREALAEFTKEFGDLKRAKLHELPSPIELFQQEFGDELLLVNGQVKPKSNVLKAYKTFNDDATGPRVMLVQSAKDKGWSGHDTTGKHQRVLINLGLPTAPTKAIQQEGRIYRTGQVSDAIIRYLNTGTSWERAAFATTIAQRSATAENLALGEQARSLQDSFVQAFEESDAWPAGHEGEGKGGKAQDRARNAVISEYDRARSMYYAQQKKTSKNKAKEGLDYFATPEPVGLKMVQWAGVLPGEASLEPSAGHGAIARWLPTTGKRTMVEPSPELRSRLALAGFTDADRIVAGTFEDLDIGNKYDAIVMNPPFGTAGRTAVDHLAKAYKHLRPGGRIVALLPVGSADDKLDKWLYERSDKADKDGEFPYTKPELARVADVLLSGSAFVRAGTGVMTRIVVLDKLREGDTAPEHRTIDLRSAASPEELFSRMEHMQVPARAKQAEQVVPEKEVPKIQRTQGSEAAPARDAAGSTDDTPKLARDGRQSVSYTTKKGKLLTGVIVGTKDEALRFDPYTFKYEGGWFVRDKHVSDDAPTQGGEDVPSFKRQEPSAVALVGESAKSAVTRVQKVVDAMTRNWTRAVPVVVVSDLQDEKVPQRVRDYDADQRSKGASGEPRGFVFRGIVYIVASQNPTDKAVAETLAHEMLGHVGLRGLYGDKLKPILEQIAKTRPKEMRAIAKAYGLDLKKEDDRLHIAEEVLAHMAQTQPELGFVKRTIAVAAQWLREHVPGFAAMRMTDAEMINRFILPARAYIEGRAQQQGQGANRIEPSLSRAQDQTQTEAFKRWFGNSKVVDAQGKPLVMYHGTYEDFDTFETGNRRDGRDDPSNAFYFTASKSMAREYVPGGDVMATYLSLQNPLDLRSEAGLAALNAAIEDGDVRSPNYGIAPPVLTGDANIWEQISNAEPDAANDVMNGVVDWAKDNGYDGLIFSDLNEGMEADSYAAFRPEQIKSATGNNGEFDASNPDIRFLRAPAPVRSAWQKLGTKVGEWTSYKTWDDVIYDWQDRFIDLKRIQQQIKSLGGTISELNNAYLGEELYHKRVAKRTQNFLRDELRPLLEGLNEAGIEVAEFERFLHARHAGEANKEMAARNPNQQMIDAGRAQADQAVKDLQNQLQRAIKNGSSLVALKESLAGALRDKAMWDSAEAFRGTEAERLSLSGMSDQEAAIILNNYPAAQRAKLDALAAKVDAINNQTLQEMEDYGLMKKDVLDAWRATYKHYIPLHRDEAHPESKAHPIGQGFSTKGDASKQRTGSNEKVTNILAHIAMQREAALTRGEKNNVAKRVYLMAAQNPNPDLWSLELPKKKEIDPDTGLVRTVPDRAAALRDNVLMVRIGGQDKYIIFNEKNERALRLGVAMRNLDAAQLDWFTRTMGKFTRWFASVNTQYNPVFSIFNFARDMQAMTLQLSNTDLKGQEREVLRNVRKNMLPLWREVRRARARPGVGQGPWAQLWEQMQLDGGTTGYRDLYHDPKDRAKELEKAIAQLGQGKARGALRSVLGAVSDLNETLENTTRLAVYKAALDQGLSRQEAASLAKNITVNFNRKGRRAVALGNYYAFLNAAIQGTVRMVEALKGPRGKQIIMGGIGLGMLSALAGHFAMGGGDGADDEWAKIPEFVKERSIIIPIPFFGGKDYVAIPMPLGYHVFPNLGRKMVEAALGTDPFKSPVDHAIDMAVVALNAYNPLGGADNFWQMVAPTPIDPIVALMENKDWTGRAIYREQQSGLDPKPGHAMAKDSASLPARAISKGVNAMTGGDEWSPGAWSWNPDAIDYIFGQFTGGVGRELGKVGNMLAAAKTGEELAPHQIPLAGRIYGNTRGANGQSDTFYENIKRINVQMAQAKGRVEAGEDVQTVLQELRIAPLERAAGNLQKRVKELRNLRKRVQDGSAPDKSEQVDAINREIELTMYRLNEAVHERMATDGD